MRKKLKSCIAAILAVVLFVCGSSGKAFAGYKNVTTTLNNNLVCTGTLTCKSAYTPQVDAMTIEMSNSMNQKINYCYGPTQTTKKDGTVVWTVTQVTNAQLLVSVETAKWIVPVGTANQAYSSTIEYLEFDGGFTYGKQYVYNVFARYS